MAILNVKDFGATGGGEADDLPAIQAAIDAAREGDTVFFPAGIYRVSDFIHIGPSWMGGTVDFNDGGFDGKDRIIVRGVGAN